MNDSSPILARPDALGVLQSTGLATRCEWALEELLASDEERLSVQWSATLRVRPEKAEVTLLAEATGPMEVSASAACGLLSAAMKSAGAAVVSSRTAEYWLTPAGLEELKARLLESATARAFACGIEVLAPHEISIRSDSLDKRKRLAGQMRHLSGLAELLGQFEAACAKSPNISAGQLLQQFSPSDQPELVRNVLRASAEKSPARAVWAVAGPDLLRLDPAGDGLAITRLPLPDSLGPLRSVQAVEGSSVADPSSQRAEQAPGASETAAGGLLLIGARSGVMLVDPARPDAPRLFAASGLQSARGFSRVVIYQNHIVASHSEAGLFAWALDEPAKVELRAAGAARWLSRVHDRLVYMLGDQLINLGPNGKAEVLAIFPAGELADILPLPGGLLLVRRNGTIARLDQRGRIQPLPWQAPGPVTCAGLLPWLSEERLLLGMESGTILARGLNDEVTQQYHGRYGELRGVWGCAQFVAAVPADRQRIAMWRPWEASAIAGEVFITAKTGHRIADVCF